MTSILYYSNTFKAIGMSTNSKFYFTVKEKQNES